MAARLSVFTDPLALRPHLAMGLPFAGRSFCGSILPQKIRIGRVIYKKLDEYYLNFSRDIISALSDK
jgi:hypothetical protein